MVFEETRHQKNKKSDQVNMIQVDPLDLMQNHSLLVKIKNLKFLLLLVQVNTIMSVQIA